MSNDKFKTKTINNNEDISDKENEYEVEEDDTLITDLGEIEFYTELLGLLDKLEDLIEARIDTLSN